MGIRVGKRELLPPLPPWLPESSRDGAVGSRGGSEPCGRYCVVDIVLDKPTEGAERVGAMGRAGGAVSGPSRL